MPQRWNSWNLKPTNIDFSPQLFPSAWCPLLKIQSHLHLSIKMWSMSLDFSMYPLKSQIHIQQRKLFAEACCEPIQGWLLLTPGIPLPSFVLIKGSPDNNPKGERKIKNPAGEAGSQKEKTSKMIPMLYQNARSPQVKTTVKRPQCFWQCVHMASLIYMCEAVLC